VSTSTFDTRKLLTLAWPIVVERATESVVGFSDALMVAPLGEAPLAAVTTGSMNSFALMVFPFGTVFILQSFAAQLRGRGDLEAVRRYAWYGLILAVIAGVLAIASIPFVGRVLALFGYEPAVHSAMTTFMQIRMLSIGFAVGMAAIGNWYGGMGNTRIAMIGGVVTMCTNVVLNYVLIQPRFGLPGCGVAGSATASVIADAIGFSIVAFAFARRLGTENLPRTREASRPRFGELFRVLRFGVPNGVNWFLEFAAFALFFNIVVAHLGTSMLAALNVVMQLSSVAFMPAFGLASAGAIFVGEAVGRRAHDDVWPVVKRTALIACAWMTTVGLLYAIAPAQLIGLFKAHDVSSSAMLDAGASMLMMAALWQFFDAIGMTLSEALRAAGDTAWCMFARIVIAWAIFLPAAWFAVYVLGGGARTVAAAVLLYLALLAVALGFRFAGGRWRTIALIELKLV
jgi:MATE family multidrug resistance protein